MAGFGGGMCCEGVCGALTGGIALISILFTEERGHKSPKVKELTKELYKEFVYRLGSDNCKVLKDTYRTEAERCKKMVLVVGDILDNLIVWELKLQKKPVVIIKKMLYSKIEIKFREKEQYSKEWQNYIKIKICVGEIRIIST